MKSKPVVVTRRALAGLLAAPWAIPQTADAQATAVRAASPVDSARAEYRSAAAALANVKLPRTIEPVTRFEA